MSHASHQQLWYLTYPHLCITDSWETCRLPRGSQILVEARLHQKSGQISFRVSLARALFVHFYLSPHIVITDLNNNVLTDVGNMLRSLSANSIGKQTDQENHRGPAALVDTWNQVRAYSLPSLSKLELIKLTGMS